MSKKKSKLEKTLVEKNLDRDKVTYRQAEFATTKILVVLQDGYFYFKRE